MDPKEIIRRHGAEIALRLLLEDRHNRHLEWSEPRPACTADGKDITAHVIMRATVHDCVNMQRKAYRILGLKYGPGLDAELLGDFLAIHWAQPNTPTTPADGDTNPS